MSDWCNCDVDTRALAARQRRVLAIVLGINVVTFVMMVAAMSTLTLRGASKNPLARS